MRVNYRLFLLLICIGLTVGCSTDASHKPPKPAAAHTAPAAVPKGPPAGTETEEDFGPISLLLLLGLLIVATGATGWFHYKYKDMERKNAELNLQIRRLKELRDELRRMLYVIGIDVPLMSPEDDRMIQEMTLHQEHATESIQAQAQKIRELNDQLEESKREIQALKTRLSSGSLPAAPAPPAPVPIIIALPPEMPPAYIKSEIMLSAGPRKETNKEDTELGEDIAGTLSLPGMTFFWLLDGTSESAIIHDQPPAAGQPGAHIFSSRLLAQDMACYFQKNILQHTRDRLALHTLVEKAQKHIREEWLTTLNSGRADRREAMITLIGSGYKPLCSTTLILGCMRADGMLYAIRIGDSKLYPFSREKDGDPQLLKSFRFKDAPRDENDRIGFMLVHDSDTGLFDIRMNKPRWAGADANDVSAAFVFSDGIGKVIEAQLASGNAQYLEKIRQNIPRIPQKTYDDKSLLVLERIVITP